MTDKNRNQQYKENTNIKYITFTHRKGGSKTVDQDGKEIKEQKTDNVKKRDRKIT